MYRYPGRGNVCTGANCASSRDAEPVWTSQQSQAGRRRPEIQHGFSTKKTQHRHQGCCFAEWLSQWNKGKFWCECHDSWDWQLWFGSSGHHRGNLLHRQRFQSGDLLHLPQLPVEEENQNKVTSLTNRHMKAVNQSLRQCMKIPKKHFAPFWNGRISSSKLQCLPKQRGLKQEVASFLSLCHQNTVKRRFRSFQMTCFFLCF